MNIEIDYFGGKSHPYELIIIHEKCNFNKNIQKNVRNPQKRLVLPLKWHVSPFFLFLGFVIFSIDMSPFFAYNVTVRYGGLAQLARAPGSYPVGRRFKSHIRYHTKRDVKHISFLHLE